jgi:hypothetical protein
MQHNAEPEAVDLLLEVERLDLLPPLVDTKSCARTCLYLTSCAPYLGEPDDRLVLEVSQLLRCWTWMSAICRALVLFFSPSALCPPPPPARPARRQRNPQRQWRNPSTPPFLPSGAPQSRHTADAPPPHLSKQTAHAIYLRLGRHHDALRVALRLGDPARAEHTFAACPDALEKRQLAYLLARHGLPLELEEGEGPAAVSLRTKEGAGGEDADALREDLRAILSNSRLSEHYLALARDLDVLEAKVPEDVYKSHLAADGRQPAGPAAVDSARANLAATLVNAFLNAGFGQDKLVTPAAGGGGAGGAEGGGAAGGGAEGAGGAEGGAAAGAAAAGAGGGAGGDDASGAAVHWVFKNKDHGKAAAVASLGMVALWDVEGGLPAIDKYLYSTDPHVVAGALLAIGVLCCCVQNENDPGGCFFFVFSPVAAALRLRPPPPPR